MAVEGHTKSCLGSIKSIKLAWPKVKEPSKVRKERFFVSFQRTLYELMKKEKS